MSATATVPVHAARPARSWGEWIAARGGVVLLCTALLVFLTLPLAMLLVRSVEDKAGATVGLDNFVSYLGSPGFARSAANTLWFAGLTTALTVPLAFGFAYAIQRSCI